MSKQSRVVLDSRAVIAFLYEEEGFGFVWDLFRTAAKTGMKHLISTVNWAEIRNVVERRIEKPNTWNKIRALETASLRDWRKRSPSSGFDPARGMPNRLPRSVTDDMDSVGRKCAVSNTSNEKKNLQDRDIDSLDLVHSFPPDSAPPPSHHPRCPSQSTSRFDRARWRRMDSRHGRAAVGPAPHGGGPPRSSAR